MAELKTQKNDASVASFLAAIKPESKRLDAEVLCALFEKITKEKPVMWGTSIVGFGDYHYVYESGREGDWMLTGFSPRKQALSLYIMSGFDGQEALLKKLGKHKTSKACLYINKLADVDVNVLEKLIKSSVAHIKKHKTGLC